jgi:hypothetical protein
LSRSLALMKSAAHTLSNSLHPSSSSLSLIVWPRHRPRRSLLLPALPLSTKFDNWGS